MKFLSTLLFVVAVSLSACASNAPPALQGDPGPAGPQGVQGIPGDAGPAGPAGIQGPVGPQGPAGPATVSVRAVDAGSACPAGGAVLTDSDGGQVVICSGQNGAQGVQGTQGAVGAQGATGATGAQGITGASSVALFQADGGRIGNISQDGLTVFVEAVNCFANVDMTDTLILGTGTVNNGFIQGQMAWTGTNCTGTPVFRGSNLPLNCAAYNGKTYRAAQPFLLQNITAQSIGYVNSPFDGGVPNYTSCVAITNYQTAPSFVMEEVVMPAFTGPFTVGVR